MIYKRYELSLSLNGEDIVHIARNSSGVVVFREHSEKELLKAIDVYEKEKEEKELLAQQKKEEKEAKKNNGPEKEEVVLEEETPAETSEDTTDEANESETLLPAQKRITRGPDGKFISKSQLDQEAPKKKGFWDKLTG